MFDENEPKTANPREIILGCDLSTFSVEDIEERVDLLEQEISRLKEEMSRKSDSINAAQAFFKS